MSIHITSMVWQSSEQSGDRLLLLLAMSDYANEEGIAWPSQRSLADRCRCTIRGVQRMIDALLLEHEFELVKPAGGRGKPAVYKLSRYVLPKYKKDDPEAIGNHVERATLEPERATLKPEKGAAVPREVYQNHQRPIIKQSAIPECLQSETFLATWNEWQGHRRQKRAKLTDATIHRQLAALAKMGPARAVDCLNYSMEKGWTGFFEKGAGSSKNGAGPKREGLYAEDFSHLKPEVF